MKLYNGKEIPDIGYGTWVIKNEDACRCCTMALESGYRHIDSAQAYGNEKGVGEAVRNSHLKREDIYVTTKVMAEIKNYQDAKESIEKSLKDLGLDYVDLILIHCPQPWAVFRGKNKYFEENIAVWKALEEAYKDGKAKAIGVSNFHNDDLKGLKEYLMYLGDIKVDGIIASDIVVIKMIKDLNLKVKVILSTQASTLNYRSAQFYKDLGVKQVVMAREAMKEDIKRIKDETGLEIECFIHGAMCTSISGKCILSNYMTGRDSNRGGCAQICRWVFNEDDEYPYTIMSKDLNYMHYIKDMIEAGVNTFKIEGRMRSIYYISTVILCYRRVIDKIYNNTLTLEDEKYYLNVLNRVANRESAPQFFNRMPDENDEYYDLGGEESNQDFLGIILDYNKNTKIATIEERNYFKKGDNIEIIGPNHETFSTKINIIYDEEDNVIEVANRPRMIVKIPLNLEVEKFDLVRIKFDIDK